MTIVEAVFAALKSFDRPATRAEIETAADLDKRQVENGLCALLRAGALIRQVEAPRTRGLYALIPGARCPQPRESFPREKLRSAALLRPRTARGNWVKIDSAQPSHGSAPGVARIFTRGIANMQQQRGGEHPICWLERIWRR